MATYEPTEEQRRTVKALSGYGVPQDGIAIHIGVDPKTLRKHFRDELDRGSVEATAKVAQTLFHLATVDKNVPAVIFWMKARAGWRETVRQETTGVDGGPIQTAGIVIDATTLDAEQRAVLRRALNASQQPVITVESE